MLIQQVIQFFKIIKDTILFVEYLNKENNSNLNSNAL